MADDEQRVSLDPFKPIQALKAPLKVDPESKPGKPKKGEATGSDAESKQKPVKSAQDIYGENWTDYS